MKILKLPALLMALALCLACAGCGEEKPIAYDINFADGESFAYESHNLQDEYLGKITYSYHDEGENWLIRGLFESKSGNIEYGVTAGKNDLRPSSSYRQGYPEDLTEQPLWHYKAVYADGRADIENVNGEEKQVAEIDIPGRCFDAECLPMLLRGLALQEGFSADFYFVNAYTGKAVETSAEVTGIEEIRGRKCYKLYLSTVELISNPMMTIYYTADADKIPVRIEQKSSVFDLIE